MTAPDQADVDQLRALLDLMANFPNNDQRARYLLSSNWMRDRLSPGRMSAEWLTVKEVATRMRVSVMTVHRAIDAGQIEAVRFGDRTCRINAVKFEDYLAGGGTK